jgi:hypothetical protein
MIWFSGAVKGCFIPQKDKTIILTFYVEGHVSFVATITT